jgi:serine/threonine protein kinase
MRDCYRIVKELGKGAYGEVMQCVYIENIRDRKSTVKDYRAVKILSKSYMD